MEQAEAGKPLELFPPNYIPAALYALLVVPTHQEQDNQMLHQPIRHTLPVAETRLESRI